MHLMYLILQLVRAQRLSALKSNSFNLFMKVYITLAT